MQSPSFHIPGEDPDLETYARYGVQLGSSDEATVSRRVQLLIAECDRRHKADLGAREFALCAVAILSVTALIGQGFVPRCPTIGITFSSAYPPPACQDMSGVVCAVGVAAALALWRPLYLAARAFNLYWSHKNNE